MEIPTFHCYMDHTSKNYGLNALCFTDAKGDDYYFSYKTLIAFRRDGKITCRQNEWGPTTGKHMNAICSDKKSRVDAKTFFALLHA